PGPRDRGRRRGDGALLRTLGDRKPLRQPGGVGVPGGPQLGAVVATQAVPPPLDPPRRPRRAGHAAGGAPDRRRIGPARPEAADGGGVSSASRLVDRGDGGSAPDKARNGEVPPPSRPGAAGGASSPLRPRRRLMDLQERLRAHMRSELANTPVSDLGGVMERGETIRRRRRTVMTAAPVVVVVLGVVGVMASGIMSDEDAPDADQVAAAEAELSLSLGTRDWAIEAASLGWAEDIAADDGVFYALSTAPGVRWEDFPMGSLPKALYVSSDGRNWSPTPFGEWRPAGLAAADGLLYVVGTAPGAAADTQTLEVRISRDGGASFESIQLPVSVPAGTYFLPE